MRRPEGAGASDDQMRFLLLYYAFCAEDICCIKFAIGESKNKPENFPDLPRDIVPYQGTIPKEALRALTFDNRINFQKVSAGAALAHNAVESVKPRLRPQGAESWLGRS
jgi:hypothetical protein